VHYSHRDVGEGGFGPLSSRPSTDVAAYIRVTPNQLRRFLLRTVAADGKLGAVATELLANEARRSSVP
jgi:hypothetical protein